MRNHNDLKTSHIIISKVAERLFGKNPAWFHDKSLENVELQETYPNIIKAIFEKPTANIILNREKNEAIPLKYETIQVYQLSPLLFKIVLSALSGTIKQKGHQ